MILSLYSCVLMMLLYVLTFILFSSGKTVAVGKVTDLPSPIA